MSPTVAVSASVEELSHRLALEGFEPPSTPPRFAAEEAWSALRRMGTDLWLDTGDRDAAARLWTREFTHLTTNNTLVNNEVKKGLFDAEIPRIGAAIRASAPGIGLDELVLEVGFVINCRVALRLVAAFDAGVSVELHPGMAHDVEASVVMGRRYFAVCPQRFLIKVPLTPAGLLATRRLSADGIPVNFTLGFSARQNVLAAAVARPTYVNVFMGRLESLVKDHCLGDPAGVGERATWSSQLQMWRGRREHGWTSRQIGASMRSASQARALAGLDVFTLPTAVAEAFLVEWRRDRPVLRRPTLEDLPVRVDPARLFACLWDVTAGFKQAAGSVGGQEAIGWTGADLVAALRREGVTDLFRDWSQAELDTIRAEGKIPNWRRWEPLLQEGGASLDDLMSTSALMSFVQDQSELDERIRGLLA